MDAERRPQSTDELIAELATRQAGVVCRAQLEAAGIGRGAIHRRLACGRLHHVAGCRGVFAVGHTARGRWTWLWAAHLALGANSVVSHRSAAALWELLPLPTRAELTVRNGRRRRDGIVARRTVWLPDQHVVRRSGLPVTTVARPLLDVGAVSPARYVEQAFDRAEIMGLLDTAAIEQMLEEAVGRPGVQALQAVLGRNVPGSTLTDSRLAEQLLAIIRRAGLPEPHQQHPVLEFRPDFCWPAARLIAEADGGSVHGRRRAHSRDTRRDVRLSNAGWTVLRFAYDAIVGDPAYVAAAIRTALGRALRSASQ